MPQENGHRSARHSSRSSPLRPNDNQNDNGTDKIRPNREIKERGYYSELATVNPDSTFEVKLNLFVFFSNKILEYFSKIKVSRQAPIAHDDVLRETFRMSNTARGI
jgi:hypothetical protein